MRQLLMAVLMVAVTAGCRKQSATTDSAAAPADRVAVVDMGQVAKDLGWIDQMQANLTTLNNRLRDQVAETGRNYNAVINEVEKGFPPQPDGKLSPAQQQTISDMSGYAQRIVNQLQAAAQSAIDTYRQQCLNQYRDAISPVVRDIATARKMSVVFDNSDTMLYHDPVVDLTAAVSAAARENIPALTPIPLPNLPQAPALSVPTTAQTNPSTAP
jgi:Skp family chaperone for outer membrane proteins